MEALENANNCNNSESDHSESHSPCSPKLCYGCKNPIEDEYRLCVTPDLQWHASCLVCSECHTNLDESCTCFLKEGRPYCKKDYVRKFEAVASRLAHMLTNPLECGVVTVSGDEASELSEAEKLIKDMDAEQSGEVSFEEFTNYMTSPFPTGFSATGRQKGGGPSFPHAQPLTSPMSTLEYCGHPGSSTGRIVISNVF